MNKSTLKEDLIRYIDAGFPLLYIETFEEPKIVETVKEIADRKTILEWSMAKGYSEYDSRTNVHLVSPTKVELQQVLDGKLDFIEDLNRTLFIIKDAHVVFEDSKIVALIKEIANCINNDIECSIIFISPIVKIPKELEKFITILKPDYLEYEDICNIIQDFIDENRLNDISSALLNEMAISFKGLSEFDINNILALAVADDGELSHKDLLLIFEQKKQMILKSGILEMIPLKEGIDDIGGLENLKVWLKRKSHVIKNINKAAQFGVDMPKGVLIAGVPGCGKSLCAKAAAKLFEVPLIRLDVGKLMGKYLGESEGNMRKAINLAEAISPCVLWIDELEKAFAGMGSDGGHEVTTRLFGTFLTWMQEKTDATFVVATANDITKLSPELMRKGRFDEIFYVGLPNESERKRIFEIHIGKRRKQDLAKINLNELITKSKGYSGADIEGVVKESIEFVFTEGREELTTVDILNVINETHSLSEIMKEPLEKMSKEYENRKFKNASR